MRNLAAFSNVGFAAFTTLDLNKDYLLGVPARNDTNRFAMVFADRQQIDYTDGLTTRPSIERDELATSRSAKEDKEGGSKG
jgi:hypothetical protein